MYRLLNLLCLAMLTVLAACQSVAVPPPAQRPPERIEARIGGPERVFPRPVADMIPLLANAEASVPNGRVGPELVFWGYRLQGNQPALLVACAVLPGVDCAARLPLVCETGRPEVLATHREPGEIRRRNCTAIGVAMPGDLTPTCTDFNETGAIDLTLLSCN